MKKELRALLPVWAIAMSALTVTCLAFPEMSTLARFGYALASVSLAALSIGHEYVYGTLASLLTQPSSRAKLLAAKVGALLPMLLSLAILAFFLLPEAPRFERGLALPRLSLLCVVLLAPWLTMVCRSPLAGIVFAAVPVGSTQFVGQHYSLALHQGLLWVTCAVAIAGTWQAFMRLEAVDGWSGDFHPIRWSATSTSPTRLLIMKELHLQHAALLVTVFYAAEWAAVMLIWYGAPKLVDVMGTLSVIYGGTLAIVIGSIASAEERQMGTSDWQTLLPIAAWKQWTVKSAVTLGLALILCVVLPTLMAAGAVGFNLWFTMTIIVITVASMYVSSLCDSGVKAVVIAAPAVFLVLAWAGSLVFPAILSGALSEPLVLASIAFVVIALRFAYDNHRLGRNTRRTQLQLLAMATILIALRWVYLAAAVR